MEKIDFVITWVDGADPQWLSKKKEYEDADFSLKKTEHEKGTVRYRDWGLLRYLFRGIERYAPWVHHIFLVTDQQTPAWLNTDHPKISVVDHKDFIPPQYLPTFNSHTIELNLYKIPGLSEQFVYFNDDCLLTNNCRQEDFFICGRSVDEAALNGINGNDEEFATIQFSSISLMNRHYSTSDCRKHLSKWLYPGYGTLNIRTLLLLPFNRLQGIYNPHGPMGILKSSCRRVWERDEEVLDETCKCRFRSGYNVSPYIFRYEQLLSGNFIPGKRNRRYCTVADPLERIAKFMNCYKMICINDVDMDEEAFGKKKTQIRHLMERKFPCKSVFER